MFRAAQSSASRVRGHRQQVGQAARAEPRPSEVLGDEKRIKPLDRAARALEVGEIGPLMPAERKADAVQRQRLRMAQRFKHGEARAAVYHVVLGMDLEPQAVRRRGQSFFKVLGLESHAGGRVSIVLSPASGVNEPWPLGVLILAQVPLATYFQALPW